MSGGDLGLPKIDRDKARRLSEAGRAVLRNRQAVAEPVPAPSDAQMRAWLAQYCDAWAKLQSHQLDEIELYNLDLHRNTVFTREKIRALEQQIARLQEGYTKQPATVAEPPRQRMWA